MHAVLRPSLAALGLLLAACAPVTPRPPMPEAMPEVRVTLHRAPDDLLTAGLGLDGLRAPIPAPADPAAPTAAELRRRAIWTNWRGIADLSPAGGYGEVYGTTAAVPGREFHALLRLPGRASTHRVMLQLPDAFDARARCLIVTASSGSRGVYGAIALASAWGLPRGCAVVHTDKGSGTDLFDAASAEGVGLDGGPTADRDAMAFAPTPASAGADPWIAYRHAHSQDNPEADWGRHLRHAAEFGLAQLSDALPAQAPFTFDNTRVIAVGLSNAGGVVLRAAEIDDDWLDAAVAIAPNVLPGQGGRALYDYASEAALWMGCAQGALSDADRLTLLPPAAMEAQRAANCAALQRHGLVGANAAADALAHLRARGWTEAALRAGSLSAAFDLWRSVAVTYASAYSRTAFDAMPCGYAFATVDAQGAVRTSTAAERALWWSDGNGIGPGLGIQIVDRVSRADPFDGVRCLRGLWDGADEAAGALRAGVEATVAAPPRAGLPLLVIHGVDDGLVPEAFSGGAYVDWLRRRGGPAPAYWRVQRAQHFDTFLGLPDVGRRYVPLLPYAYAGLDAAWALLEGGPALRDAEIAPAERGLVDGQVAPLRAADLALPR